MNDSIRKGYAGENFVLGDLTFKGITAMTCSIPTSEYDLIADNGERLLKVQVKSGEFKEGKMQVDLRRPSSKARRYNSRDYDVLAIVELASRRVAYFPYSDISKIMLHEKYPDSLNGYKKNYEIHVFEDYLEFPLLSEIGNRSTNEADGGNRQAI